MLAEVRGLDAGAAADALLREAKIPLSHRLMRQKPNKDVNNTNQPNRDSDDEAEDRVSSKNGTHRESS